MGKYVIAIFIVVLASALVLIGTLAGAGVVYALTRASLSEGSQQQTQEQVTDPNQGLVIVGVAPQSAAEKSGIVRGDILQRLQDQPIKTTSDITRVLGQLTSGQAVEVIVLHGDHVRTHMVDVEEQDGQPSLGIRVFDEGLDVQPGNRLTWTMPNGAVIVDIIPESPAARAGLQIGDRITALNGNQISADMDLAVSITTFQVDDEITLDLIRGDESMTLMAVLAEHPDKPGQPYLGVRYLTIPNLDGKEYPVPQMDQAPMLPDHRLQEFVDSAVVVAEVVPDGPGAAAGIMEKDVIIELAHQTVGSLSEVQAILAGYQPGESITVRVRRPGDDSDMVLNVELGAHPEKEMSPYLGLKLQSCWLIQGLSPDRQEEPSFCLPQEFMTLESETPSFEILRDGVPSDLKGWLDQLPFDLDSLFD